jgi:hypothetical protein
MGLISTTIRWVGFICAGIMLLSFILFATDQSSSATKEQVNKVNTRKAPVAQNTESPNKYRQKLDEANEKLSQPFDWATKNISSDWAQRGLTALMGVLVFGLGFAWLANLVPKPKMREPTPWHT